MEREKQILAFWKEKGIFEKTLSSRAKGKPFVFYDGPPFATGLPHYGHILAGTIKDAIPRYQTMRGRSVRREWGWDCHGLPLENIVEQELGFKHKKDIEAFGIGKFNETAKKAVLRYERDWKEIIPKTGRFVEMEHPYKTMDASYTESVWWSWKTLWDKKLAYEGYKIMYVCPRCETPLAQSEVAGSYKDVTDLSVIAKFELLDMPGTHLLAWTTTPWTLPGNTALAVNPGIEYAHIELREPGKGGKYVVATERLPWLGVGHAVLSTFKGKDLVGRSYKPLFDYYAKGAIKNRQNGWKIYPADFVTTESGTGIVHVAPAFGEDDMELCNTFSLPFVQHVSMDGRIKEEVADLKGLYVKQKGDTQSADIEVIRQLAARGLLFAKEKITHSYPLCWRCDTPLLNYATSSWFVKVSAFKEKLLRENRKVTWVPAHLKEGRFGKWLEGAKDWAVSRSRFWGAPLPVWRCAACKKLEVVGSLAELQTKLPKSGNRYFVMRHGHAASNGGGTLDSEGDPDNHLTEKGKEEARKAAKLLKREKISRIVASPLIRARETAGIVGEALGVPVSVDERLREIRFGEYDGRPARDYEAFFKDHDHFTESPKGAETHNALKRRVMGALSELEARHRKENILMVAHESGAWMLKVGTRGLPPEEGRKFWDDNAGNRKEIMKNGEVATLPYAPFPRNDEWELDYHRPYIDEMRYPCACGGEMKRIEDVFDCWYESGSMPYGQFHYPFENQKLFKNNFPADFIAEGLDQTRGWFYSMMVLCVALFGETPYRRVIVNGIILAEDGQKMSKKLKNYPDPMELVEQYGADALRYYLLASPVVRGEDINFSEKAVVEVSRKVIGRLMNVHAFYETYQNELKSTESHKKTKNPLDLWVLSRLAELREEMTEGMERYELDSATRGIDKFVDDLSTWYLRRSRERFKGDDALDKEWALSTTRHVLLELSKLVAPFMPFTAEALYRKLRGPKDPESVHPESWPERMKADKGIIEKMATTRALVELALAKRAEEGIKVRQPLASLAVPKKQNEFFAELVRDEVNVKEVREGPLEGAVMLDIEITAELKKEGQLRELIRAVQELRKENKLTPRDRITLVIDGSDEERNFIREFEAPLKKAVLAEAVKFEAKGGQAIEADGMKFIIAIEK